MSENKMALFSQDLNVSMTEIHNLLEHWGLKDWREYLVVRVPDKPESFIVLAHPSDKSDFADQLIRLHKDDACGDYKLVDIPDMDGDLLREFTATMRAADECFEKVGGGTRHYIRDCLWPEMQRRGLSLSNPAETSYVPGELRCPVCGFRVSKRILCAANGEVGVDAKHYKEFCPNDETEMQPLTWQQQCEELNKVIEDLLRRLREHSELVM